MPYFSSAPCSPGARAGSQTFHSSKQIFCRRTDGGTLFPMRARSMSPAVIWIALSADLGAVGQLVLVFPQSRTGRAHLFTYR